MKINKYKLQRILGLLLDADSALDKVRMSLAAAKLAIEDTDNDPKTTLLKAELDEMINLLYADDVDIVTYGNGDMLCIPDRIAEVAECFEEEVL